MADDDLPDDADQRRYEALLAKPVKVTLLGGINGSEVHQAENHAAALRLVNQWAVLYGSLRIKADVDTITVVAAPGVSYGG